MLPVQDVPISVVTGFLGVGKTTAIRHLLASNADAGRWAVLVNEFGEVGIDGALLGDTGLSVHEIPGGCICCSAGLALQVALVRMLREVRPARVIIEPTGLAHPASVLDLLRTPGLREAVSPRATLTLVDPRHLADPRVVGSDTWKDQVMIADVLVANKTDLTTPAELQAFRDFAAERWPPPLVVAEVAHGAVDPAWLDLDPSPAEVERHDHDHDHDHDQHQADRYTSRGWIFPPAQVFDRRRLQRTIQELVRPGATLPSGALRLKGVFRTPGAWLEVHGEPDRVSFAPIGWRRDSRVDVITEAEPAPDWNAVERLISEARLA